MNTFNIIVSQMIAILSLVTASGVLIHDTNIDKAFASAVYKPVNKEMNTDTNAAMRAGSNPHTHAEHMSVRHQGDAAKALPRERDRKRLAIKRVAQGYHGNGICMPLAGEWQ